MLQLFEFGKQQPEISMQSQVAFNSQFLNLEFVVRGGLQRINWGLAHAAEEGPANSAIKRQDGLWNQTCFEMFFGEIASDHYWEFNVIPSGYWNLFSFQGYRLGKTEEPHAIAPEVQQFRSENEMRLKVVLPLSWLNEKITSGKLEIGITGILVDKFAERSFWALKHCGERPDFHLRNSFVAHLEISDGEFVK